MLFLKVLLILLSSIVHTSLRRGCKTIENSKTVILRSGHSRLQEVVVYKKFPAITKALTGKILVFWSLMRGLVAYTRLSHMEVRLYS